MDNESTHTRIYKRTLQNLRRIHAETGEKILEILDRAIQAEWAKVKQNADSNARAQDKTESDA